MGMPKQLLNLSESLSSLPGIGPKLSNRLALYLSVNAKPLAKKISSSIEEVLSELKTCKNCGNISESDVCEICNDDEREQSVVMVVEDSLDLYNIEASEAYTGMYHVLGGLISPINGISPSDINIDALVERVKSNQLIKEIVFALNPTIEGDSTSMYIKSEVEKGRNDIVFTQLAKGIATGSDIEFISSRTLSESVKSRVKF